jgi:4-amino-4-deoxy-L-arabinose transferase-like glycosyltransferase
LGKNQLIIFLNEYDNDGMILKIKISETLLVLFLILILAFLLRSWNLTYYPMEGDESHYLMRAINLANDPMWIWKAYSQDPYWFSGGPPLHSYLVSFLVKLLGPTEFALKITSAIFGSLTVLLVYFLTEFSTNNRKMGFLAAVILGMSFFHVFWSRTGYREPVFTFFLVATCLFFIAGTRKYTYNKFNGYLFLSFVFLALALFTRWTAIAVYIGILIWLALFERKLLFDKFMIIYAIPTILLMASIIPTEIKHNFESSLGDFRKFVASPIETVCLPSPTNTLVEHFFPERCYKVPYYLNVVTMFLFWSPIEFVLAGTFLIFYLIFFIKNKKIYFGRELFFILLIFTVLLISYSRLGARAHRNNIFMPFISMFAGISLFHIYEFRFGKIFCLIILTCIFIFTIYFLLQLDFPLFRDASYYLKQITSNEDFIVGPMQTLFGYYSGRSVYFFDFRENELQLVKNGVIDYLIFEAYYSDSPLFNTTRKVFLDTYMVENKTFYYRNRSGIIIYQNKNPLTPESKKLRNCLLFVGNVKTCQRMMTEEEFTKAYEELKGRMF